ncbi:uncharacterized protein LOC144632162 [Oculina patagonica]
MDDRTFVLWRGTQRINFSEEDLTAERISAVFRVERNSLYLQDDFTRVARFPNSIGNFETTLWRERTSLEVKGAAEAAGVNGHLPSPQDLGISAPSTSTSGPTFTHTQDATSMRSPAVPRNAMSLKTKSSEIRKKIFLAEFDAENYNPIPMATAYLKLRPEECNIPEVARMTKEYLNLEEDLIIMDNSGFEILDNPSTRGSEFWGKGAMKIYACREVEFERIKLKKAKAASRQGKKRGHSADRPSSLAEYTNTNLILEKLDEIEEAMQRNQGSGCCKRLHDLDSALTATFKCTICLNVMSPQGIVYAGCCDRLVACTECADEWYANSTACPHCRDEEGRTKRKRARGFETLVNLIQN